MSLTNRDQIHHPLQSQTELPFSETTVKSRARVSSWVQSGRRCKVLGPTNIRPFTSREPHGRISLQHHLPENNVKVPDKNATWEHCRERFWELRFLVNAAYNGIEDLVTCAWLGVPRSSSRWRTCIVAVLAGERPNSQRTAAAPGGVMTCELKKKPEIRTQIHQEHSSIFVLAREQKQRG